MEFWVVGHSLLKRLLKQPCASLQTSVTAKSFSVFGLFTLPTFHFARAIKFLGCKFDSVIYACEGLCFMYFYDKGGIIFFFLLCECCTKSSNLFAAIEQKEIISLVFLRQ